MSARALRLAFFGTPAFAVPALERLLAGRHPVAVAVTQPDRPRGRGRRVSPSPVAAVAERAGVPLLKPERAGEPDLVRSLEEAASDLGVVVAFGQFLPRPVRRAPSLGYLINAHASLLPRWRGAAPVAHAILAGDERTGVSIMRVVREMDAGPVALRRETAIGPDETAGELETRLAGLAADAVEEAVEAVAAGRIRWHEQDPAQVTHAPRISGEDARLDFAEPAEALARRVRAMAPRPGARTTYRGERLRILAAGWLAEPADAAPGTVHTDGEPPLRIATGSGWLVPRVLQRAGGRPVDAGAFLRGRAFEPGARLGS